MQPIISKPGAIFLSHSYSRRATTPHPPQFHEIDVELPSYSAAPDHDRLLPPYHANPTPPAPAAFPGHGNADVKRPAASAAPAARDRDIEGGTARAARRMRGSRLRAGPWRQPGRLRCALFLSTFVGLVWLFVMAVQLASRPGREGGGGSRDVMADATTTTSAVVSSLPAAAPAPTPSVAMDIQEP